MSHHLAWICAATLAGAIGTSTPSLAQAPQPPPAGFTLLTDLVVVLHEAALGKLDAAQAGQRVVELARRLRQAADADGLDPIFAVRYSRLLSAVRQGLLSDPSTLYWPMYRHSMIDFIEERTGRMPDWNTLLVVVNDHGGSGVGLAMLVEPVMAEVVSLQIHLENTARRPQILQAYLEKTRQAPR